MLNVLPLGTIGKSVRTIRTLNIIINSNWVDFFVIRKIILLGKGDVYDKYYQARNNFWWIFKAKTNLSYIEPPKIDKKEIEITNQIRNLFLEDYGLTNESFEEEKSDREPSILESLLDKRLVKKQPNLTIVNHIKYI